MHANGFPPVELDRSGGKDNYLVGDGSGDAGDRDTTNEWASSQDGGDRAIAMHGATM